MKLQFRFHWQICSLVLVACACKSPSTNSASNVPASKTEETATTAQNQKTGVENATPGNEAAQPVQWLTFEEAVKKSDANKKPIFIDVYTDWCGWCKVMDKNTFNDPQVAKLLNEKFYAVKFDAEQKEDVVFNGNTFKFVPSGGNGYHQLAAALLNNQLSYPTVVFLTENFEMIQPVAGYRKAPEFHKIAQFIGEGHYKTTQWTEWESKYTSPY